MSFHFYQELKHLNVSVKKLVKLVDTIYACAIESVKNSDEELAKKTIKIDKKIDQLEIQIEEECLKILALHQPLTRDLRYIVSMIKVNNDLERIADFAVNIARRVEILKKYKRKGLVFNLSDMFITSQKMLTLVTESLFDMNIEKAYEVLKLDPFVNEKHSEMYKLLKKEMRKKPDDFDAIMSYASISRFIERVSDHCTNIAEDIIYTQEGKIIRHSKFEFIENQNKKTPKKNTKPQAD